MTLFSYNGGHGLASVPTGNWISFLSHVLVSGKMRPSVAMQPSTSTCHSLHGETLQFWDTTHCRNKGGVGPCRQKLKRKDLF